MQGSRRKGPHGPGRIPEKPHDLKKALRDLLAYCRKWVAFQQRFAALLPVLPLYSNLYCDFYPGALQGYDIAGNIGWSRAILGASLVDGEA